MFPILFGPAMFGFGPLMGREVLSRTCTSMAVALCEPYRHSRRYHDMVEYYSWKLERRYERNMAYKGFALCNDAVVCWAVTFQFLRLLQLAQHLFTTIAR